jgi:hypothetical protein
VAARLEAGGTTLAEIEAVMLRLPDLDAAGKPQGAAVRSRPHHPSTENANGFYPDSKGGGVLYIPSISAGQSIQPTEVHVLDASAFRVGWTNDTVTLVDRAGHLYAASANDFPHFNATTGKLLGVSIRAFPGELLGSPDAPPTAAEQRQLDQERAAFEAGRQASEQSWSGRVTTGAVLFTVALPFAALAPAAAEVAPNLYLNSARAYESAMALARRVGAEGEQAVGITGPKVGIRIPGSGQLRIPDGLDVDLKVLTEVKNVAKLDLTPQLRDFLAYCRATGYRFELWIRPSTEMTERLLDALARDGFKPKYIPGAK